jgi:hypothetical protein
MMKIVDMNNFNTTVVETGIALIVVVQNVSGG